MLGAALNRRDFIKTGITGSAGISLLSGRPRQTAAQSTGSIMTRGSVEPIDLRFRQIHLDFHTSEHIKGIGGQFDPDEFADTLAKAHVNSVTCFGRCHHGYIYHNTVKFPERHHPHLKRNLLKEQIDACHKRNIRVPIYVTVQWDQYTSDHHPEWLQISRSGSWNGTLPYEAGFYRRLCMNSPYRDFLKAYLNDLFEAVPVDGLFLDIVHAQDCSCNYCQAGMESEGINPSNDEARLEYGYEVFHDFITDISHHIRQKDKDCTIFYNSGHIGPRHRNVVKSYTHLELESLPSGGWGYLHFPLTMRFARQLGVDCMGMTGKFHTSWGDFHSFKNPAALQFECFNMLALNAKCSIGDQLHPNGKIDPATYDLVGSVYADVAEKEPWCAGAKPVTEIGVLTPEEFSGSTSRRSLPFVSFGVVRMLQEGAHQFDMLDTQCDFSPFKVLILPDTIPVSKELAGKLDRYVKNGGSLIATFESGLDETKSHFALQAFGVEKRSNGPVDEQGVPVRGRTFRGNAYAEYIVPNGQIGKGLPATEHVMYMKGMDVEERAGSEVLAYVTESYFNRTFEHFCSHRQTPSSGKRGSPAVVRNGNVIYFSHPIFSQYQKNAPRWCRIMFLNALELFLQEPLVRHDGPSTILVTVNKQSQNNRWIMHLLHYIPERRGNDFDIIEDVIPVYDVALSVKTPKRVRKVEAVPQKSSVQFKQAGNRTEFIVRKIDGHQMIALNF